MKLKEIFYGIGFKPRLKSYSFRIANFSIKGAPPVQFAQWEHPSAIRRPTQITDTITSALSSFLNKGDFAIDIGAHGGDSTLPMALCVGSEGLILALEPNVHAYKILIANAGLNPLSTNIHPWNIAATDVDGEFVFGYSDAGFCNGGLHPNINKWTHSHFLELKVVGKNLHDLIKSHYQNEAHKLKYIKIDTEGADLIVLKSLESLITTYKPYIRTEIYKHSPAEVRQEQLKFLQD